MESESVAYVVGRHFGLDVDNATLYIARWQDDDVDVFTERLVRISSVSEQVLTCVEERVAAVA